METMAIIGYILGYILGFSCTLSLYALQLDLTYTYPVVPSTPTLVLQAFKATKHVGIGLNSL